jgi:hypothetical protein
MSRRLPEEFEGKGLEPLCLALRLSEAREIETVLDRAGIDYTFEISPVTGGSVLGVLFGGIKKGVMFLVPAKQHERSMRLLEEAGLSGLLVE